MNIGVARIVHRSNSFALDATKSDDFDANEYLSGEEVSALYRGTGTSLGAILDAAQEQGISVAPLISASAPAGGPVETEALDEIASRLIDQIASQSAHLDGLILEMTGAMSTVEAKSGEEHLLSLIREEFPTIPFALTLEPCANVTESMIQQASVIESAGLIPDREVRGTASRVLMTLQSVIMGDTEPKCEFVRLPLIIPIPAQRSTLQPLSEISARVEGLRQEPGVMSASVFAGFPYTDAPHAGASVIVYGTGDASKHAQALSDELWKQRQSIFVSGSNVEEAVHHAMASREETTLIADLGDNPDDGAPGDGTTVLWALMDLGVRNATVGAIADPQAVEACFNAGVDAKVEIPVGGRRDTRHGYPIDIRGKVVSLNDGQFTLSGPLRQGCQACTGRVVVLDVEARHEGHVELILTEKPFQITDTSLFEHVGIDIQKRSIVSIKSANDYLPAFSPLTSKIFEVITPGITTPDPAFFAFQNVRRPIYPLDQFE